MPLTIGKNIAAIRAQRQLAQSTERLAKVNEQLASGQRINSAGDDAAGLAISDSLRTDRRVLLQGIKNINDGISQNNIADSAVGELTSIVIRQRELAAQSANGTLGTRQRRAVNEEAQALSKEYFRIARTTSFNGVNLFDGSLQEVRLQAGYGVVGSIAGSLGGSKMGDGTFQARVTYATGFQTTQAVITDANGDGTRDVIASSYASGAIVHLGNGNGTFQTARTYATTGSTRGLSVGDVNNDGRMDLITANQNLSGSILLGNGNGTFQAISTYNAGAFGYQKVTLGDMNGDGLLDIVGAGLGGMTGVHLGNGNGTFQNRYDSGAGGGSEGVLIVDLNKDEYLDVIAITSSTNQVGVALGNGNGTFQARRSFLAGGGPVAAASKDINDDGNLDLVVANYGSNDLTVHLGNGNELSS